MNKQEFLQRYLVDRHGTDCSKWDGLMEKFRGDRASSYVGGRHGVSDVRRHHRGAGGKGSSWRVWVQRCARPVL